MKRQRPPTAVISLRTAAIRCAKVHSTVLPKSLTARCRRALLFARRRHPVLLIGACASAVGLLASAAVALPGGLRFPSRTEASQIIKFTGYTLNCVKVVVDDRAPKWALIEYREGRGCQAAARFTGLIVAHETAPRNLNTAGLAWTQALRTAHPMCPLPHVPKSVAKTLEICTVGSGPGRIPHF